VNKARFVAQLLLALHVPLSASQAIAQPGRDPKAAPGLVLPARVIKTPLSAEEQAVFVDIEKESEHYLGHADKHNLRVREVVVRAYRRRTDEMEKRYAEKISAASTERSKRHQDTVALLEKFLEEHPNHSEFTPDKMYQLADAYLDQAEADVEEKAIDDPNIIADYSKSLLLWEDILQRFPDYRQLPQTLYLLAYYGKTKDERRALQLFLSLACANKYKFSDAPPVALTREEALARTENKTRRDPYAECQAMAGADDELVRHAWVRGVADYHFSVPGEIDESIASYLKVVDGAKDSPLYAEALYKLAWSFYKRDMLPDSIARFDESIKLYDGIVASGSVPALELRDESIQYVSVAFTDPWDGETDSDPVKAFDRAKKFYEGRESEPHVRDVWVAMGRAFAELQAYDQAVDAYRIAIGPPWELNPETPVVHQEIANVFEAKGDKFAADSVATELAIRYAPGTPWYVANEKDREAMDHQHRIAERALYAAARNTHTAANALRKEWEASGGQDAVARSEYLALYGRAVELYQTFINQYPESDYVYEFTYGMGDALYFSDRYLEAVVHFRWVRDHRHLSEKFFLDAAKSILSSYEAEARRQAEAGVIEPLRVPSSAELRALPQPLRSRPIPDIYRRLQNEWDNYQNVVPDPQTAPAQGINAALVSLAYLHVDDAVTRFEKVMAKFCGSPEAVKAKDGLLSVYESLDQLDKFQETNNRFIQTQCGDSQAIELALSQNRSIEFRRARDLLNFKRYIEAGDAFYRYYRTAPSSDADVPIALYNSAVSYKLGDRPKTAIALFGEFTRNPDKKFRESPFYLEAMRLTALSYQASFDYDAAIASYLELYNVARRATTLGIKQPEPIPGEPVLTLEQVSLNALYNAAFVAELDRDFSRAIELYLRYEKEEPDRRLRDRSLWSIARIHRSAGKVPEMIAVLDQWRSKYGGDAGNDDDFVTSYYDTAAAWQRKGKVSAAEKEGEAVIAAWRRKGAPRNSASAKLAGEWGLYFAEKEYAARFEPYRITTVAKNEAQAKAAKAALEKVTLAAQEKYKALDEFGVAEVSMAAKVRYGESLAKFADKLVNMPTPRYIIDLDKRNPDAGVIATYEEQLGKLLKKYVDQARVEWQEVVDLAKKNGISNQWSQLALENLNREFPDDFDVLHQELFHGTEEP
jgi:tetratricopeptide (TPR) repeat protein